MYCRRERNHWPNIAEFNHSDWDILRLSLCFCSKLGYDFFNFRCVGDEFE
jgi:hypothetical protein